MINHYSLILLLLALMITAPPAAAQSTRRILQETDKLIAKKHYESAFKLLMDKDPENKNGDLVQKKVYMALNFYVSSIMHQLFAFSDLRENEQLDDLRGKDGTYPMVVFDVPEVLRQLMEQQPKNFKLYKTLGDYYYDVHLKYGPDWIEPDSVVLMKIRQNYSFAKEHGEADYLSTFAIAYVLLNEQKYAESVPFFLESIAMNENYPAAYYNLAYAYLYMNERKLAIDKAQVALEIYDDPEMKADAARMIGVVYSELDDKHNALKYYELSNDIDPYNYYTLKNLLDLELMLNYREKASKTVEDFFRLGPSNPTIYNDLVDIYINAKAEGDLIIFFNYKLQNRKDDHLVTGNLHFYLANIYMYKKNNTEARKNLSAARKAFESVLEPDNYVFKIIDDTLKEIPQK